jgi:hypothetical protein
MRRSVVAFLAVSGCFANNRWHNTAYHIDGLATAVGGFLFVTADSQKMCDPSTDVPVGGPSIYTACLDGNSHATHQREIGGALVGVAVAAAIVNAVFFHGIEKHEDDTLHPNDESQIQTEVDLLDLGTKDERLIQLTKEAAFAARKSNCRVVRTIYQRVRVLDPEFSETGFVKDNTIERCVRQQDTQ